MRALKEYQMTKVTKEEKSKKRAEILDWARDHNLIIHPGKGFDYYAESFFKFNACPCDLTRNNCPCPESVKECEETGHCLCRLYWASYDAYKIHLKL